MIECIAAMIVFLGSVFCLLAAIGLVRMPDLLIRMHASTKAGTLGISLILLGTALSLMAFYAWLKVVIAIVFLFITGPIAAHMLARAAYFIRLPLSPLTQIDELRDHYDEETHNLDR